MARYDDVGLFWEDKSAPTKGGKRELGPPPEVPETGWVRPKEFPNLSAADFMAIDTETYDPHLIELGPGWARGDGHIVGVSVAVPGHSWYFPMRHEHSPEQNMDPDKVLAWLSDSLGNEHQAKIGANLMYDVGWLREEGVTVKGQLVDVQYAESLLDNNPTVALDHLGAKYIGEGKETDLLYQWLSDWYGGEPNGKQRKWIYSAPPSLVGPYAEGDAELPLEIIKKQYPLLRKQGLTELFDIECRLIRLLIDMRYEGVSVDVPKAERVRDELMAKEAEAQAELDKLAGMPLDVNGRELYVAFDKAGLGYPKTAKGNPSFTKPFLENLEHPLGKGITEVRRLQKMRSTFVEGYILDANVNGKLYGQFHPLKSEEKGAMSGRFSSSKPNLQNIPSRDKVWAPLIRGMFVPDEGHVAWRKYDYSQIEYRLLAHFAKGPHAHVIQGAYNANPETDYHSQTGDSIERVTGKKLPNRSMVKGVNFGRLYGMGKAKLKATLGLDDATAEAFLEAYDTANPYVRDTMDYYSALANDRGYVETILGRRARFDLWEPTEYNKKAVALPYDQASLYYGSVRRAYTHKAVNNVLQGSSADQLKYAMLQCYESGVFDVTGVPRLTVHDELDFSDPGGVDDAFDEIQRIMATCLKLKVPVIVDCEIGPDWGSVEEI